MHTFKSLIAALMLFALIALTPKVRAADQDCNGRRDIQVHAKPADFAQFTTTAAWWLAITGAGTPDIGRQSCWVKLLQNWPADDAWLRPRLEIAFAIPTSTEQRPLRS